MLGSTQPFPIRSVFWSLVELQPQRCSPNPGTRTSVPYACCLWQPARTTGTRFHRRQARRGLWDALLPTQGTARCAGCQQPGTEQHPRREARLAQRRPPSPTSLSVSILSIICLKKKGKTNLLLPCEQSPHASPSSASGLLRTTTPAPCTSGDDAPRPPTREAWAFKRYIARRH